jgi:hypothetical protein
MALHPTSKLATMIGKELPIAAIGHRQKSTDGSPSGIVEISTSKNRNDYIARLISRRTSRTDR